VHPTRTNILTTLSILHKVNRTLITYPRYNNLLHIISVAHLLSQEANEPQCIALEGRSGTGKTTLVCDYTRQFPRIETPNGTEIPVFYMETPSPVTVKGMACRMLGRLGDPAPTKGWQTELDERLVQLLIDCRVQLVILDDFHHLIDSDTDRVLSKVSEWLKVLIKESHVPFLVVGIEGKVERILEANEQLSRLFAYQEPLEPFKWDERHTDSLRDFAAFVAVAEKSMGISLSTPLPRPELLRRLHYATEGVVANIMNLLRHAAFIASEVQRTDLDLETLESAFETRLSKHLRHKENPFQARWGTTFVAPEDKLFDPAHGVGKRLSRRSDYRPTTNDILKT